MKIKAKVSSYKTCEINVEFPLFLKYGDVFDSGGFYDSYVRYDDDGRKSIITQQDDHWEFETKTISKGEMEMELGYHLLEQGDRSCEPKQFYDKLEEFMQELKEVPTAPSKI